MAKTGLRYFRMATLQEYQGNISYGNVISPGGAISWKSDISSNDAKLYTDDALNLQDTSFNSGTVTMTIDKNDINVQSMILGHEIDHETGSLIRKSTDIAPFVGVGCVVVEMVKNVDGQTKMQYKVQFLYKVKFSEVSGEYNTKGDSTEFGTYEYSGTISALADSLIWSNESPAFENYSDAKNFLDGLFVNIPSV